MQDSQDPSPSQKSDPRYVTIPFEYYRTLVQHFYSVVPSSTVHEGHEAVAIAPAPIEVGDSINLRGIDLFEEMPEGYRKLNSNGD